MPLVLAASFDDHTREQVENHVSAVQARRMVAAMEYHAGKTAKLTHESDKVRQRMAKQYDMLAKEIDRLEKAENAVLSRLETLEALRQEIGLITDMIETHGDPTEQED